MDQKNATVQSAVAAGGGTGAAIFVLLLIEWLLPGFYALIDTDAEKLAVGGTVIFLFARAWSLWGHLLVPSSKGRGGDQAGFAHPMALLLAVLLAVLMVGCVPQHRAPENVYESLLVANKYGELVTHAVNDLRRAAVITHEQHQEALDYLQDALDKSVSGRRAYQLADFSGARTALERTEASLRLAAVLLVPYLPDTPQNESFIRRYGR